MTNTPEVSSGSSMHWIRHAGYFGAEIIPPKSLIEATIEVYTPVGVQIIKEINYGIVREIKNPISELTTTAFHNPKVEGVIFFETEDFDAKDKSLEIVFVTQDEEDILESMSASIEEFTRETEGHMVVIGQIPIGESLDVGQRLWNIMNEGPSQASGNCQSSLLLTYTSRDNNDYPLHKDLL